VEVDLGALNPLEKDILFSYSSSADIQDLAARLVFERQIDVRSLVTHRFALEESARAVEVASRPAPGVLKVVVEMGRS
jgi:threonine dehydrogenase-like Zn-dependent dehydrogenase